MPDKFTAGGKTKKTTDDATRTTALSRQQGKAVEAEALLTDTLAIQQRVCGPEHPATQRTAQFLEVLHQAQHGEA